MGWCIVMHRSKMAGIGRRARLLLVVVMSVAVAGCLDPESSWDDSSQQEDRNADPGPCEGNGLTWRSLADWDWSATPAESSAGDESVEVAEDVFQLGALAWQRGTRVAGAWDVRVTDASGQERLAFVGDSGIDVSVGDNIGGRAMRTWDSHDVREVIVSWSVEGMVEGVRLQLEAATC